MARSRRAPAPIARLGAVLACPLVLLSAQAAQAAPGPSGLEYALKAAFIYKLAAFVQWPSSAFVSPTSPLDLCVAGANPFGGVLDQAVVGQHIESHPIVVRRVGAIQKAIGCHILYVAVASAPSAALALRNVRGAPVLTITDSAFEDGAKGIVHFVIRDGHVRFEIDPDAASQGGIVLSSKLRGLAVIARPTA